MSALGFCRECGNMIQTHYHYCPFCGDRQGREPADECAALRPPPPDPAIRTRGYLDRLRRLDEKLSVLDRELGGWMAAAAGERRRPSPASVSREIAP